MKTRSTYHTMPAVAAARASMARHESAGAAAVDTAARWLAQSDEWLWNLPSEQAIPRDIHVSQTHGCPSCGKQVHALGNYPWKIDVIDRPWKVECPCCGEIYPKNDFGKYYLSGKDEHWLFDETRADKSLLVGADGERHLCDDRLGGHDEAGVLYRFIPCYNEWGIWKAVVKAVDSMGMAYVYTGDIRYARKTAILLARVADVYPELDYKAYADRGMRNDRGKFVDYIWMNAAVTKLLLAYDAVFEAMADDAELVAFLRRKGQQYRLPCGYESVAATRAHIEERLLRETVRCLYSGQIVGNMGMPQKTMAVCALVADAPAETASWVDWIFSPDGGDLHNLLISVVDRDGMGNEASPSYNKIWPLGFREVADILARMPGMGPDLYEGGKLLKMLDVPYKMVCLDKYVPNIGDCQNAGGPGLTGLDLSNYVKLSELAGDPVHARVIELLNAVGNECWPAAPTGGEWLPLDSTNLAGYGLTILRSGCAANRRCVYVYFGRTRGHGHRDMLNLGVYGYGLNLLPDLGYPEYTDAYWPKRHGWTRQTVSHNTVLVNKHPQNPEWAGRQTLFACSPRVKVVEHEGGRCYHECSVYSRTTSLVDIDDENYYIVDILRVKGGNTHHYSFHAGEGEIVTDGLNLVSQARGTLAGEDVGFGEFYDGEPGWAYEGTGFQYLYNVARDRKPGRQFSVDWSLADTWGVLKEECDVKLRLTMLHPNGEVIIADGDPPQNKPGNPRRLKYVLVGREGADPLESVFVSVIQPYRGEPFIRDIEALSVTPGLVALRLTLLDGTVHTVMNSSDSESTVTVDGLQFKGRYGFCSTAADGNVDYAFLADAEQLGDIIKCDLGRIEGLIEEFDTDMGDHNCIYTSTPLPTDGSLAGRWLHIQNDGERDASYEIVGVSMIDGRYAIDLGDITFVRELVDDKLVYNFGVGDRFVVPGVVWKDGGL